ncbi:acyl-CoA synthetase short-chain family member 3, mitochondrial-like isoform X2 [Mytilus edulis]|uniref:acyl-CoA synthetase short-chain family member 3, mitochondrial-like isoform X2 n=1 Tax=Mytilus edulis TaxID=6550 RepID=UPI0039EF2648
MNFSKHIFPSIKQLSRSSNYSIGYRLHRISCTCSLHHRFIASKAYDDNFLRSINSPEDFWAEQAEQIVWHKKWDKVLDNSNPPFSRWFVGGELNTCYNAVDRHVEAGNGEQVAIIYDSPITKQVQHITYKELLDEVSKFASVLRKYGVEKGDRVLIYMPMIPQAVIAMLASARIGAIHSLVFGGFAAKELGTRIDHAKPKVVVSASCGVEPGKSVPYKPMLDGALSSIDFKPNKCVIYNRPGFQIAALNHKMDVDWQLEMLEASPVDCVPVLATDPIYILYTSGTTGLPKAVVRPSGGHAVVLKWSMWNIYGLKPKDVWWAASDLGWVVGHSYIAYAPLLNGNTTILFEGKPVGTPDPGVYFRILREHDVKAMFVAPTALRAVRREDPEADYAKKYKPLHEFQALFVAGEHCDKETMEWSRNALEGKPVLDNWWQTETGWAITSTCAGMGMNLKPPTGTAGKAVPGWDVKVLRKDLTTADPGELGQIAVKLPLPPGAFSTLWESEERFKDTYYKTIPGYYDTMDAGFMDEEGYVSVMARTDDVINVAGHRLSTGQLEEAMLESEYLAEAAVVGIPDELKGEVPLGLCVLKHGITVDNEKIFDNVRGQVRKNIGPVASFNLMVVVPKLPKTRSGKIARNTIAAMAAGKEYKIPVTIEDASVYPAIQSALKIIGYPKNTPIY